MDHLRPSIIFQIEKTFAALGSPLDRVRLSAMTPAEIYAEAECLHGGVELLATIGSWGDTLDDADVLAQLRSWNERGTIFAEVIAPLD